MFKKIRSLILILFLMLPQILLSKEKSEYLKGKEIGITRNEVNIINDLKKNDIITKENKLIDYNKMNIEQTKGMIDARSLRFDRDKTIKFITETERKETTINSYKNLKNAEKIMVNYLLYAKGKEPVETTKELNKKLEVYQENLDDIFEHKIFGLVEAIDFFPFALISFTITFLILLFLEDRICLLDDSEAESLLIPIVIHTILAAALPIKNPNILTIVFLVLEFILYNSCYGLEKHKVIKQFEKGLE